MSENEDRHGQIALFQSAQNTPLNAVEIAQTRPEGLTCYHVLPAASSASGVVAAGRN